MAMQGQIERSTASFHHSIWGDIFISYVPDEKTLSEWREKAEILKGEVWKMLSSDKGHKSDIKKLSLIDAIQRLGVAYHFEEEIQEELTRIFTRHQDQFHNDVLHNKDIDLSTLALRFRLLRQHGFNVTCDVFRKFMDDKGNIKTSIFEDLHGLLSLYEATHLRVPGEKILDNALKFTATSLESLLPHLSPFLAKQVRRALYRPLRKTLPPLETRNYISVYEQFEDYNETLLEFAKLDFNILQKLHQEELSSISKWWKALDVEKNFHFARDRVVELYFWVMGVYSEPHYSRARRFLTQVMALTSIIDDTYDNYGTREELDLFTTTIDRWDISAAVGLPAVMKVLYRELLKVYQEAEDEKIKQGKPIYGVQYAKEAMKKLTRAFFEEVKWIESEDVPTVEEYKKVSLVSSGYPMIWITSVVFMDDAEATEEAFQWLITIPKPAMAASTICRLMDDITSHEFEQERKHPPSIIECFIAQYGMSKEETYGVLRVEIEDAWKDLNEAFLRPNPVAKSVLMRILNLARVIDFLHKTSDAYTHVTVEVKDSITSLLVTPLKI